GRRQDGIYKGRRGCRAVGAFPAADGGVPRSLPADNAWRCPPYKGGISVGRSASLRPPSAVYRSPARWPTRSVDHPTIWRPTAAAPGGQERRCPRYESAIDSVSVPDVGRSASFRPPSAVCTEALTGGQREALTTLRSGPGRSRARRTRTTLFALRICDQLRA